MKKLVCIIIFLTSGISFLVAQNTEVNGCRIIAYHGNEKISFEAYGDVFVLTNEKERADIDVKVVGSPKQATYKIFRCADKPKKCGEWRFVTNKRDAKFTIRFVNNEWADCCIYYTDKRSEAGFNYPK